MEPKMTTKMNHGQPSTNQPMPAFQTMPYDDDEIDLREVFATLWRRKKFIGLGLLLFVITAFVIVSMMPDVYRVKSLVSPGIVSQKPGGNVTFTNTLESVKGQIDAGAYNTLLASYLEDKFPGMRYSSKALRVTIPKKSSALSISYDTPNQDFGKSVLSYLIDQLMEDDAGIIKPFVEGLQAGIESKKKILIEYEKRIVIVSSYLKHRNKAKKILEEHIANDLKSTRLNTVDGVQKLIKSDHSDDGLYRALVYNNMVIQNRQILSDLVKELSRINAQINLYEQQKQSTSDLIRGLLTSVDNSARVIDNIKPFQEIIPVMTEEGRVGPKRRLIVMMSFVCGLFFMIFAAFIAEYIKPSEK